MGLDERPVKDAPEWFGAQITSLARTFVPGSDNETSKVLSPLADMVSCNGKSLREYAHPRHSVRNSRSGSDDKKPPNELLYDLYIKETPE